jgi:predicted Zn-dependent peptidase
VITEEVPNFHSVSIGVWIDVGSRDEDAGNNGIAHFLEHAVFKGTAHRRGPEIARSLESVGGYLNAFTGKEHTCFYARVMDEFTPLAVDVLADIVLFPTFPVRGVEKERLVILEEIKDIDDTPDDVIFDYFDRNIYQPNPLSFPVIGNAKNVASFSRNELLSFVERHYTAGNMVVAAAGKVDHEKFLSMVEKKFRQARRGKIQRRRLPDKYRHVDRSEYRKPINQAHVCYGRMTDGINSPHRYPLIVLNTILGDGMSSRLYQRVREKRGIAYSIYSFINLLADTGSFGIYLETDVKNVKSGMGLIRKELDALQRTPVSARELDRAKAQMKGSILLGLEGMSNRMMRLGTNELYFGTIPSLETLLHELNGVTPEKIHTLARRILKDKEFSTVVIQPV